MGKLYKSQRKQVIENTIKNMEGWVTADNIREIAANSCKRLSFHSGAVANLMRYLEKHGKVEVERGRSLHQYRWIGD